MTSIQRPLLDTRRGRARLVVLTLGAALLVACAPYLPGLAGAAILYVVCVPVHRRLAPRIGARKSALALSVASVVLVLVPVLWLAAAVAVQTPDALRRTLESETFARLSTVRMGPVDVGAQLERSGELLLGWLTREAWHVVGGLTRGLLNLLLAVVGAYYLLNAADAIWARIRPIIPFSAAGSDALRRRFASVTEAMLLGIAATATAQGTVVGLAFWLAGLPDPIVWGAVTAVVSVLPVLGSALVWAPGALVLVAQDRIGAALLLAAIGFLVASNVDNLVRPIVYRRVSDLHPMTTLVGAFAGVELMGLVGLLLGPLAITWFFELAALFAREYGTTPPTERPTPREMQPAIGRAATSG